MAFWWQIASTVTSNCKTLREMWIKNKINPIQLGIDTPQNKKTSMDAGF